ncbi:cyclic-phosphate processing receiver domain-containing protein [Paenibacillus massiliensis]|uniref:cyclic-phosphate processing receiver domain-containing protein n=1 Tax=Paenibacillus massiliensis TaxID=225917 RepID=UPI000376FD15|nr:cyclic-phosphate processing receiver domain-containing protein [Paenibacillus massiliensis]
MHLYMDDYRPCPQGFALARDAEECIVMLRECHDQIDILSLDFDLGPWGTTGLEVASAIVREKLYPRRIYLHSSSDYGRRAMYELLYEHKPNDVQLYNHPMPHELLIQIAGEG